MQMAVHVCRFRRGRNGIVGGGRQFKVLLVNSEAESGDKPIIASAAVKEFFIYPQQAAATTAAESKSLFSFFFYVGSRLLL
jgi:hypothetical protein